MTTARTSPLISWLRGLLLVLAFAFGPWLGLSQAQAPPGAVLLPLFKDTTNGSVRIATITGMDMINLPDGMIHVRDFKMRSLRDGQDTNVAFFAEAPQCRISTKKGSQNAGDPGPVKIYTPTTNLYVQGTGFFIAESNQVLVISNEVETRVARTFLRTSPLFAGTTNGTIATNGTKDDGGMVLIFSDHLRYDFHSNVVEYVGHVRVVDPQFQLTAPLLTIEMGSNQTVTMMFAREGVTLTPTGKGAATGSTAHYYATNGIVLLDLAGAGTTEAEWRNGEQEATSHRFTYRPDLHFLTGDEQVRVRWPNPRTNEAAPQTFRELEHADHVDLQMTMDGRAVDGLTALGNVNITNQADHSRATGGKVVYNRTNDLFTLTDEPLWRTEEMEVAGEILSTAPSNNVFHAQDHARLKLHIANAGPSGLSNQWLTVTCDDILDKPEGPGYLSTFRGEVHAQLRDGETVLDKLSSQILFVHQNAHRQLETVIALHDVHGETAPDAKGVTKTVLCDDLTADYDPATGRWKEIIANTNAELASFGGTGAVSHRLTADLVKAHFSATTNQLESAQADGSVIFFQTAPGKLIHATGDHATYAMVPEEAVELIGHPFAETDKGTNRGADRLKYNLKNGTMESFGRYHITPRAHETNGVSAPHRPTSSKPHS